MQFLQTLGVFFLILVIFGLGFIFGRRNGIKACSNLLKKATEDLSNFELLFNSLKKEGCENGEQGNSEVCTEKERAG